MELLIQPLGQRITAASGSNLLEVLRAHEVPVSYSCLSGRCGTCRCKVLAGQVLDSGPEAGRPLAGRQGTVLACQAVLTEDCSIELPALDEVIVHPARVLKATVSAIEPATHDILKIRLMTAKPLDFSPGQYASLQFTPEHIRPYSMAGLPVDEEMEFQVRKVPGGRVTAYVFESLRVGAAVRVSGPMGSAYLRRKHAGPLLCVGGGTGIAPVLSIVRGALAAGMGNPLHVYFGVRSEQDLYDAERFQALAATHPNLHFQAVVATGTTRPGLRSGLVTDAIAQDFPDLQGWRAYVCGAPAMVEAVNLVLLRRGVDPGCVHADAFYPSGV